MRRFSLRYLAPLVHWRGRTLALICLAVFVTIRVASSVPIEILRAALFDTLQTLHPREWRELPVVIVDIDESSLARFGQWPWPRTLLADLVDRISAQKPLAIGFDILFAEPDRLSPQYLLDQYPFLDAVAKQVIAGLEPHDARFARSLSASPSVLGIGALGTAPAGDSDHVSQVPVVEHGGEAKPLLPHFPAALQSLSILRSAAHGHGVLNVLPESDGIIRRVPLAVSIDGTITPTLTLEMLRVALSAPNFAIHRSGDRIMGLSISDLFIPTEADARAWVNFTQPRDERYVSAAAVLDDEAVQGRLTGKLVLLGSSALGLVDTKAIPIASHVNGIEIHAMLLESIIAGELLSRPAYADRLESAILVIGGLLLIVLVPRLHPKWALIPIAALIVSMLGASWAAHRYLSLLVDTSFAGVSSVVVFAVLLGAILVESERTRRLLQGELESERAAAARMEGELQAARTIQLGILPSTFPAFAAHREFDLHAMLEPARAVGGDLYDFAMLDEHHLFFIVGDVSGKGIPASLFMALTKALYKSSALRRKAEIEQIMTEANAEISRENSAMMFVTALSGILDIRSGCVEFCNAGHDAPILLAPGHEPMAIALTGGPPLCVVDDFEYPRDNHRLKPGEAIVLYTDGVTEAMNPQQILYTARRLHQVLGRMAHDADCATIVQVLYTDIVNFADGAEPSDDVTVLVLRYLGPQHADVAS